MMKIVNRKKMYELEGVRMNDTDADLLEGEGGIIIADADGEAVFSLGADGITPGEYPYIIWVNHQDTATRSDVAITGKATMAKVPIELWTDMFKTPSGDPYFSGMPLAWTFDQSAVRAAAGDTADYGVLCPAIELVDGSDMAFVYGIVLVPAVAGVENGMMKVRLSDVPSQMTLT